LSKGAGIKATITAYNAYGDSTVSAVGNGGVVVLVPDAPVNLNEIKTVTSDTQIGLGWTDGTSNGGSIIIDY
jgi:hypothetical protein